MRKMITTVFAFALVVALAASAMAGTLKKVADQWLYETDVAGTLKVSDNKKPYTYDVVAGQNPLDLQRNFTGQLKFESFEEAPAPATNEHTIKFFDENDQLLYSGKVADGDPICYAYGTGYGGPNYVADALKDKFGITSSEYNWEWYTDKERQNYWYTSGFFNPADTDMNFYIKITSVPITFYDMDGNWLYTGHVAIGDPICYAYGTGYGGPNYVYDALAVFGITYPEHNWVWYADSDKTNLWGTDAFFNPATSAMNFYMDLLY